MQAGGVKNMGDNDTIHPRDRISKLPDFIVHHIMPFLSAKEGLLIGLVNVGYYFPFLDEWIEFVVGNEVKELDFDVQTDIETIYTLPRVLFSAKWVTTLKLSGCKLKLPSDTLKLHSLRSLALVEVRVNREMIQKLVSECLLLEELSMVRCHDMKCIYISKAFKLKIININVSPYIFESIEIDVPSLQQLKLGSTTLRGPIVIDGCLNLSMLQLSGLTLNDQEFHRIFSKLPLLENLNVLCCPCLESVTISSDRLEKLSIEKCFNLKAIDVHTPNLLYFSFVNNPIPVSSMNAPRLRKVELGKIDPDTRWYLET
ncbi:hypothetical protein EZV62_003932 [Acer yangbiense]|uniref:At1g61320/AtMIF1 LRR domain-containing protein n=1 Tax=Acer yangbiense TaxID=1000413 RepID=A0A5C7II45_9ROSI|nr:hypothetical protein EZV62_003932 [Acer yangbiense]